MIRFSGLGRKSSEVAILGVAVAAAFFISVPPGLAQGDVVQIEPGLTGKLDRLIEDLNKRLEDKNKPAEPAPKISTIKLGGEKSLEALDQFANKLFDQLAGVKNDVELAQAASDTKKEANRALAVFRDVHSDRVINWPNDESRRSPERLALFEQVYRKLSLLGDFALYDFNPPWQSSDRDRADKFFNPAKVKRLMYLSVGHNYGAMAEGVAAAISAPKSLAAALEAPAPKIGRGEFKPDLNWGEYFLMAQYDDAIAALTDGQYHAYASYLSLYDKNEFEKRVAEDRTILKQWSAGAAKGDFYSVGGPDSRFATDYAGLYYAIGHFSEDVGQYLKGPNGLSNWRGSIPKLQEKINAYKKWKEANGFEITRLQGLDEALSNLDLGAQAVALRETIYQDALSRYKAGVAPALEGRIAACLAAREDAAKQGAALCQRAGGELEKLRSSLADFLAAWKEFYPIWNHWFYPHSAAERAQQCIRLRGLEGVIQSSQPELEVQWFYEAIARINEDKKVLPVLLFDDCAPESSGLLGNPSQTILTSEVPTMVGGQTRTQIGDVKDLAASFRALFKQTFAACPAVIAASSAVAASGGRRKEAASPAGFISEESVRKFYADFAKAYESGGDVSSVMSSVSPDWSSSGGESLADLSSNLTRSFATYRNLQFQVSGLKVLPASSQDQAKVSYHVVISGELVQRRGIINKEESDLTETIGRDKSGKLVILNTEGSWGMGE